MRVSPQLQGISFVTSLMSLGGFVSGVYQGLSEAKGSPIDPGFRSVIRYGPIVLNGLLGFPAAIIYSSDPSTIDDLVSMMPVAEREKAEGCIKGCISISYPVLGATFTAGLEYVGYLIGKAVGHGV